MTERTTRDPVCGARIGDTPHRALHAGVTYAFCSAACLDEFRRNPTRYVTAPKEARHS